ncbi:MAG: hypothetical protein V7688_10995 [Alcanivorax jadensis]|uniref:hypothetical protein n=1 Tax=Alcanivorax jadensis TaxID=64988 RepID=UPI0030031522
MSEKKYPKDNEIKVQWTNIHIGIIVISFFIWPGFLCFSDSGSFTKMLSLMGLQLGTIGVVVSSLKTPPYGAFMDGGELEFKRAKVEGRYFQRGMWLIAIGFILQAWSML